MLRIFRGERPAAAGTQAANAQEKNETTSASSDASRPIGAAPADGAPYEHVSRPGEAAATASTQPLQGATGATQAQPQPGPSNAPRQTTAPPQQAPTAAASTAAASTASASTAAAPTAAAPTAAASTAQSTTTESSDQEPRAGGEPGFLARGNIRRRARFLRAARELAYRDLGGLVFDLHRFAQRNDEVVQAKLTTLSRIDAELRSLEEALKRRTPLTVLRQAGVSACPRCAAIHGSFDRFCPACGLPVKPDARPIAPAPPAPPAQAPATRPAAAPAAAAPAMAARAAVPQPTEAFMVPDPDPDPEPAAATSRPEPTPPSTPASTPASESGSEDGETEVIGPSRQGQRR